MTNTLYQVPSPPFFFLEKAKGYLCKTRQDRKYELQFYFFFFARRLFVAQNGWTFFFLILFLCHASQRFFRLHFYKWSQNFVEFWQPLLHCASRMISSWEIRAFTLVKNWRRLRKMGCHTNNVVSFFCRVTLTNGTFQLYHSVRNYFPVRQNHFIFKSILSNHK